MFTRRRIRLAFWVTAALCLWPLAAAGQLPDIEPLRTRDPLTQQEREQIREWLTHQEEQLVVSANPEEAQRLRRTLLKPLEADPPATVEFRTRFIEQAADVAIPLINKGNGVGSLMLMMTLVEFDSTATRKALLAGLESTMPAVRYWSARGVGGLASRIEEEGPGAVEPTIDALQQAGARESSPVVLRATYQALRFGRYASRCAQTAASVLDTRVPAYQTGRPETPTADLEAFVVMSRTANPSANVVRLCGESVAKVLKLAAEGYVRQLNLPEDQQDGSLMQELAPVIQQGEALLKRLCQQAAIDESLPNLSQAMKGHDAAGMQRALSAWFGQSEPNQEGLMNRPPFNMPRGLGVELSVPKPTPTEGTSSEAG